MIKAITIIFLFGVFVKTNAQTGIGTTTPNASAKLDVYSDNKGFLPPRVTLTDNYDKITIPSPATGLLVYHKGSAGLSSGYYFWNGNAWATIATSGGSGSFAASFMRGSRTASQSMSVNDNVIFSNIDNSAGSSISLNTTNGKITLSAGNTYRLIAAVPGFSGSRPSFMWYNETSGSAIGSAANAYAPSDAAGNGASGGIAEVIITPTVNTVVYFKLVSVANSTSTGSITAGSNGDFVTANSYPWFEAQVISGNAPVTGQSVDYIQASQSANQTLSAAGNVIFNVSTGAGITLTNGGFELKANKTYKLEAALGGASTGYGYYAWVDNTNNLLSGGSIGVSMKAGNAYTDAPQDKAVVFYTPTSNTTVYLRVVSISGTVTTYPPLVANGYSSSWATIQQVGSSAIVNPWTLAGSNTYNTLGKVGIGNTAPNANLDIRTSPSSTTDPGIGFIGIGTTTSAAGAAGAGALRYNASNSLIEFSNGNAWLSLAPGNTPMYAQFSSNAAQYFNAIGTKILFQTTNINVGSISNANNGTIYLPAGRIYRVDLNLGWANVGWSRFAIYNVSGSVQLSQTAHIEAGVGYYAGTGMTTCFINTSSGAINIEARFVAPLNSNSLFGDTANGGNYPSLTIQTVD